jgi:hypothetical protein
MGYELNWGNNCICRYRIYGAIGRKYELNWGNNCIHIKYKGVVNLDEMIKINGIISRNPQYNYLKFNISDFLSVTSLNVSQKDIEVLSRFHAIPSMSNPNLKLLVVSDNNDIREKVLRYIQLMKDNEWEVALFDQLEDIQELCNQE